MTLYILRNKHTLLPFPVKQGNTSFAEFTDELPPRLFKRPQDALFVARWWARGHAFQTYAQRNDEYDSFQMTIQPVEGRCISDLEIVEVEITATNWRMPLE